MSATHHPEPTDAPMYGTLKTARAISGLGETTLYRWLGLGRIRAVKAGKRLLIDLNSLREFLATLPPAEIKPPRSRKRSAATATSNDASTARA